MFEGRRIGIIGAGRTGGSAARLLAEAGHEVKLSLSGKAAKLEALARGEMPAEGRSAAALNAVRLIGVWYARAFNTLTSRFQAVAAGRSGEGRGVLFLGGDDAEARSVVAGLIDDAGFAAVGLGGSADAAAMEAPRRDGAVCGEEYHRAAAEAVAEAVGIGRRIPRPSIYESWSSGMCRWLRIEARRG